MLHGHLMIWKISINFKVFLNEHYLELISIKSYHPPLELDRDFVAWCKPCLRHHSNKARNRPMLHALYLAVKRWHRNQMQVFCSAEVRNCYIFVKLESEIKLTGVSTKNISELSQTWLSSWRIRLAGCSFSLTSSPVCESLSEPSFCIISLMSSSKRFGLGGTYLNW